eukprot:UN25177
MYKDHVYMEEGSIFHCLYVYENIGSRLVTVNFNFEGSVGLTLECPDEKKLKNKKNILCKLN